MLQKIEKMKDECMAFADRLKSLRKEKGIRQDDLAAAIGVSKGTVSVWERGLRIPDFGTLHRICDFFGITLGYLLGTDEARTVSVPDDAFLAEQATEDEVEALTNLAEKLVRLSDASRRIVAGAILAAYRTDRDNGTLEANDVYDVQIRLVSTKGQNRRVEVETVDGE